MGNGVGLNRERRLYAISSVSIAERRPCRFGLQIAKFSRKREQNHVELWSKTSEIESNASNNPVASGTQAAIVQRGTYS